MRQDGGEPLLLTAAHVVGSLSAAHGQEATEVLLATGPAVSSADPRIGEVVESHPDAPTQEIELDACLVAVDEHVTLAQVVRETNTSKQPRDITGQEDGEPMVVHKRGINHPHLTSGLLDPTPSSLLVRLPLGDGTFAERDYLRGYLVHGTDGTHPFARGGDSGAIVVDDDDCVVGLVVALRTANPLQPDPGDPTFIIAITDILDGLRLGLTGPNRPCTLL